MDAIRNVLFEDPTWAYAALVVAELVLIAVWFRRRSRRTALLLLIGPVLGAGAFALDRLVVTDREQIIDNARQIAHLVERGDVEAVRPYLRDTVLCPNLMRLMGLSSVSLAVPREAVLQGGRAVLKVTTIEKVGFGSETVEVTGGRAEMKVGTFVHFRRDGGAGMTPLAWRVQWVKIDDRWLIDEVDCKQGLSSGG